MKMTQPLQTNVRKSMIVVWTAAAMLSIAMPREIGEQILEKGPPQTAAVGYALKDMASFVPDAMSFESARDRFKRFLE
jgi:predicted alternative tryptophan synthase beta-subunit